MLTYAPSRSNKFQNLEAFIVNQAAHQPSQPDNMQFGGGNFSGGGAGSGY